MSNRRFLCEESTEHHREDEDNGIEPYDELEDVRHKHREWEDW